MLKVSKEHHLQVLSSEYFALKSSYLKERDKNFVHIWKSCKTLILQLCLNILYLYKYLVSLMKCLFYRNSMADITTKLSKKNVKPPNVLIYADSFIARNNVKNVLEESLGTDKYDHLFYYI